MKELKDILSITGKPGLYRLITTSRASIIVESLDNGKRMPIPATAKISSLDDISIFTYEGDVPLREVFEGIYKVTDGKEAPNPKTSSHADLRSFIADVLPNYDEDRVYHSDLKKLMQWFNFLLSAGFFNEDESAEPDEADKEAIEPSENNSADSAESAS